jgi:hypothetical protein
MKYRFTKENHCHELLVDGDWKKLTGVTTVLSVIAKPALISWAANMAVDYIKENALPYNGDDFAGMIATNEELLEQARKAHTKKKEEAGKKGTDTHAIIEEIIKDVIKIDGTIPATLEQDSKQVKHFTNWAIENKVRFLESELGIYSENNFLGGIVDFVCEIDGEVWIGDIKTGNGIYAEAFWQMGGYELMINELKLYPKIKGYIVLNLRKNGEFEEKRSISNEENIKAFLSCLNIYRTKQKIENQIL